MKRLPSLTAHAILRFVERGGAATPTRAEADLVALLAKAKPAKAIPAYVQKKQRPGQKYLLVPEWVLVVKGRRLVTVFARDGQWRWAS